ncbi:MAG: VWA domain-containing protein [Candidatus Omnitrophica bacterium]|nr:VWA domain-containing protein [Candidatus Omnitrophota bacterium]
MRFQNPIYLFLLLLVPLFVYLCRRRTQAGLTFSNIEIFGGLQRTFKQRLAKNIPLMRALSLALLIAALARPQTATSESTVKSKGIDIILALDISTSMLAEDFTLDGERQSRLDVIKQVADNFINLREKDRIGIVAFAGRAYTVSPLTLDHSWLLTNLNRVEIGLIEDGTAIGSAIASSINRLKDSTAKSRIIILLTDGINNTGKITPAGAAGIAGRLKIKIYTIGAGSKGLVPYPVSNVSGKKIYQPIQIDIDEDTLREIAIVTRAKYYRATDTDTLKKIFSDINKLEQAPLEETAYKHYNELSAHFIAAGFILLLLEVLLSNTILARIP